MIDFFGIGYIALMIVSFLSATILPVGSEPLFIAMVVLDYNPFLTISIASVFNTLGGMTNYLIGRAGRWDIIQKYTKIKKEKLRKLQNWVIKYGALMSLLTFLPWIGDPLAVLLGFMRVDWRIVLFFMFLSKTIRYIILWYITVFIKINIS